MDPETKKAKSGAERTRAYRERIRQNKLSSSFEDYKQKDRERKQRERAKPCADPQKKRNVERLRKRAYRAKKRACVTPKTGMLNPFGNESSLGKAVQRARKSLPHSPHRKTKVVATLIEQMTPRKRKLVADSVVLPNAKKRKLAGTERKKRNDAFTEDEVTMVENFYEQDDISRMCPGKKEFVSVKTNDGRVHIQKRVLQMNISEAHQLFLQTGKMNIGLTKFASLRPVHVFLTDDYDQEVCLCRYHEDVEMLACGIRKIVKAMPSSADEVVKMTLCSLDNESCIDRQCQTCGPGRLDCLYQDYDEEHPISYYKWITEEGRTMKVLQKSILKTAKEEMATLLLKFPRHVYNARRQHAELRTLKEKLGPGEIILHEDFSENYTLKYQREIMSAHWSNHSVTLFTAIIYYKCEDQLCHLSYSVISDELSHDKKAVYAFNDAIIEDARQKLPFKLDKVHYWSDGCGSQFKNKYMFCNLLFHISDFECNADWSFFETAHGKGPIDGIGGEVKRCVWRSVLQGKEVVGDAKEFYRVAEKLCKKIIVIYVDSQTIKAKTEHLEERWRTCIAIPGTLGIHYLKPISRGQIGHSVNSQFSVTNPNLKLITVLPDIIEISQSTDGTDGTDKFVRRGSNKVAISWGIGDWVMVLYDGDHYPGQVTSVNGNNSEVNCMIKSGANWRWPERSDVCWYTEENILRKLPPPVPASHRGLFTFKDID